VSFNIKTYAVIRKIKGSSKGVGVQNPLTLYPYPLYRFTKNLIQIQTGRDAIYRVSTKFMCIMINVKWYYTQSQPLNPVSKS
jgi:hypothetical protein